jgi:hypothetical protein
MPSVGKLFAQCGLDALRSCYAYSQRFPVATLVSDSRRIQMTRGPCNDTPVRRSTAGSCPDSRRVDRILLKLAAAKTSVVAIIVGRGSVS